VSGDWHLHTDRHRCTRDSPSASGTAWMPCCRLACCTSIAVTPTSEESIARAPLVAADAKDMGGAGAVPGAGRSVLPGKLISLECPMSNKRKLQFFICLRCEGHGGAAAVPDAGRGLPFTVHNLCTVKGRDIISNDISTVYYTSCDLLPQMRRAPRPWCCAFRCAH